MLLLISRCIFSESLVNFSVNSPAFEILTPLTEAPSHQSFQQLPEMQHNCQSKHCNNQQAKQDFK